MNNQTWEDLVVQLHTIRKAIVKKCKKQVNGKGLKKAFRSAYEELKKLDSVVEFLEDCQCDLDPTKDKGIT